MPVVICTYLDSEDVPLVGRLDITRVRTDYRVQDIGTTLLVSKPLVNGSVSVTLAPGQYLFKAYGSNGKLRQSDKANVPDVDGTVYLASLVNSTPITEDEWDRSVEAVAIRLKADPEFIDLVSEGLAQDGVLSFNGRTGDIIPQPGDYSISQVTGLPDALANLTTPAEVNDIISPLLEDKVDVTYVDTQLSGKEATGVAASLLTAHLDALNPHNQYALQSALDAIALALEDARTPLAHEHNLSEVTGLESALANKASLNTNVTFNNLTSSRYFMGSDLSLLPVAGNLSMLNTWAGLWLAGHGGDTISTTKNEGDIGQYRAIVLIKGSAPDIPLFGGANAVNATSLIVKQASWQEGLSQEWHDSAGVSRARMTHTGELEVSGLTVNGVAREAAGTAASLMTAHTSASDPHGQYVLESALGTVATQNANNVAISGGTIDGTPIGVTDANTIRGTTGVFTSMTSSNGLGGGAVIISGGASVAGNVNVGGYLGLRSATVSSLIQSQDDGLGGVLLDFTLFPIPNQGANVRFFRTLNTVTPARLIINAANGTSGVNCQFGANTDSSFNTLFGNIGLGMLPAPTGAKVQAPTLYVGTAAVVNPGTGNIQASGNIIAGGFRVGTGATVTSILTATKTISSPSVTDTITVTGAQVGDHVLLSRGIGGFVSASNTVQFDSTGLSGVTVRATVLRVS